MIHIQDGIPRLSNGEDDVKRFDFTVPVLSICYRRSAGCIEATEASIKEHNITGSISLA
jgi:hypothetical protein